MAQGTETAGAQPKVGRQMPGPETASPDAARASADASAQPTADVVAMVSRDANGEPAQTRNFRVMVDDDAPDHVKDAHWNKAGEAMGAKHVDWDKRTGPDELDHDERAKTEAKELARIRKGD
jgi:hypothetical protein